MKKLSNKQLVLTYQRYNSKIDSQLTLIVKAGLGDLNISQLRAIENKPKCVVQYLILVDKCNKITDEAHLRYGPGLMFVTQLGWSK